MPCCFVRQQYPFVSNETITWRQWRQWYSLGTIRGGGGYSRIGFIIISQLQLVCVFLSTLPLLALAIAFAVKRDLATFSHRDLVKFLTAIVNLTGILMESSESVRIFRSLSESSESHVISSNPMEITGKSGGKSGQFGKKSHWNSSECCQNLRKLCVIFESTSESLECHRNVIYGILTESLEYYWNLWNIIGISEYLESYQNL